MYQRVVVIMLSFLLTAVNCISQQITKELEAAIQKLSLDEQFKHAVISLLVVDSKTSEVIYDRNGQIGLSPASCQKVITSISAFELLGKGYQYKTYIGYDGQISNGIVNGNLYLRGIGDPTLGSDRWNTTTENAVLKKLISLLQKNKISSVNGDLICDDTRFTTEPIPGGWVWEDIGNYYGAGAWGLNWHENQFDVSFKTGVGKDDSTTILSTKPAAILKEFTFANFIKTGNKTSGDNGYLYSVPFHKNIIARGTLPISANGFTISGAMPNPPGTFIKRVYEFLNENGVKVSGNAWTNSNHLINNQATKTPAILLDSILSPTMDSINYWFLKKSVNLFGEAFVKAISFEKKNTGSTDSGIAIIKEFWGRRGIEKSSLKIIDGSGLSPANRITANSLVTAMQYARSRPWFAAFYNALPEMNGIKMKDGYITGVRSYTGYISGKNGIAYTFAFMVNNFDGSAGLAREKIWNLLNILK